MKRIAPLAAVLLASAALSGCGLRPLYAGGGKGAVAQSLSEIEVAPIPGQAGWLVRNAINDRLAASGAGEKRYRLEIELDDKLTGFGVRTDNAVTRERRTLRARYKLVEGTTVVLDATAGSDAGIDVVSSEYATIAAEQTALENLAQQIADQIVTRLALYAKRTQAEQ
ncbi:MAG: LPS assembly lipoprotein LptE [Sphingomonadaceae bacterium]